MFITTIKKSFSATVLDSRQDITNSQFTTLHSIVYTRAKGQGRQSQPLKKKKSHPMLLASCSPSLNSLHCPKVKAPNAHYNYTNKPATVKPENIVIIIQF